MAEPTVCERLKETFPEAVRGIEEFRGETHVTVEKDRLRAVMAFLKENEGTLFDMLVDIAGVDLGNGSPRFEIVYLLHSMTYNNRLEVKIAVPEGAAVETMSDLWKAADWMEREVFDLFGIAFNRHPDLRRILLPDDYDGHPLRKDYPLKGMDFDKPFPVCLEEEKGIQPDA